MHKEIIDWLVQNSLALYGAITGTAALCISFLSHRHNIDKDIIKLTVSYTEHPNRNRNVELLEQQKTKEVWDQRTLFEAYIVTVCNLGSVSAPLHDVGVIDNNENKHQASIDALMGNFNIVVPLNEKNIDALQPKASAKLIVYYKKDQPIFYPKLAYVIDQTGKQWFGEPTNT